MSDARAAAAVLPPPTVSPPSELLLRDDGPVRWLTLARPASKNGLTLSLNQRLIDAFDQAAADTAVRCVVLTGAGGSFCSGLDLKAAMAEAPTLGTGFTERLDRYFQGVTRAVVRCPKPVVALVDGAAAGFGCDLALACDIRIGTPRTRFGEIFVKRGLMPDGGGTYFLPRLVGVAKALELMLLGDMVDAEEALRLGLVSRLVGADGVAGTADADQAIAETAALAARLAEGPPLVHGRVKQAVYASLDGTLEDALARERRGQSELIVSADFAEGVLAFFEKRPPRFQGR